MALSSTTRMAAEGRRGGRKGQLSRQILRKAFGRTATRSWKDARRLRLGLQPEDSVEIDRALWVLAGAHLAEDHEVACEDDNNLLQARVGALEDLDRHDALLGRDDGVVAVVDCGLDHLDKVGNALDELLKDERPVEQELAVGLDERRREFARDAGLPSARERDEISLGGDGPETKRVGTDWTRRWRDSDSRFSSFIDEASAAMSSATSSRM
jgi:hypothetical protein